MAGSGGRRFWYYGPYWLFVCSFEKKGWAPPGVHLFVSKITGRESLNRVLQDPRGSPRLLLIYISRRVPDLIFSLDLDTVTRGRFFRMIVGLGRSFEMDLGFWFGFSGFGFFCSFLGLGFVGFSKGLVLVGFVQVILDIDRTKIVC